ncbi:prenyltransferase/squalene oxidase repeat-containing protein [Shouchella lehensis]|uniref:Squalene--hopene cyclase n=1 Tax=Shouchella lehensis G1 TaxID=1246626 RepID=A0A060M366_9BACI|nr:prenyltransferase/squalene oxidase repeat-containing protein [Shouchella lehensis]AIC96465.1 Squalene--hopene cyclase [Shouchella lehensis G1]
MNLISRLTQTQLALTEQLITYQQEDGSFKLCFESGTMTDAYMLLLLSHVNQEYDLQKKLAYRLLRTQSEHGYWKLYEDDLGHLSSTIEAYTALYISGFAKKSDPSMKAAESFIVKKGGVEQAHISTKTLLALHHLYPWPTLFPLPLFLIQLPKWMPFSFYRYSAYVKTHFAALLILGHTRFHVKRKHNRHIQHLYISSKHLQLRKRKRTKLSSYTKAAFQKAETYLLHHIEQDGTLHSYSSGTLLMFYALLALGYKKQAPIMEQALEGLKTHLYTEGKEGHIQNSPSTIWDTALIATAIQQTNTVEKQTTIAASVHYILANQQKNGGWGFSTSNSINPDVDDTHACLRLLSSHLHLPETKRAWRAGFSWLLSRQNRDGGWAAFEKDSRAALFIPLENGTDTIMDPSSPDLTGRTLECLGNYGHLSAKHPAVEKAIKWLEKHQQKDGNWQGRWGVSYIYGTWAAVTGMRAVGVPIENESLQHARRWLESIQLLDGGWGESCKSDVEQRFIPLQFSTVVHTAWALDALISLYDRPTKQMEDALTLLMDWVRTSSIRSTYPTGGGLPGQFYIHYHSYPLLWPLVTFTNYKHKYVKTKAK